MGLKAVIGGLFAGLLAMPAQAEQFSGFYVGILGGYSWQNSTSPIVQGAGLAMAGYYPSQLEIGAKGGSIGAMLGYGATVDNWYSGLEADFSFSFAKASDSHVQKGIILLPNAPQPGIYDGFTIDGSNNVNWYSTVRGRFGWTPFSNSLLYGTAGVVFVDYDTQVSLALETWQRQDTFRRRGPRVGAVFGGGLEYALLNRWRVRAEYLYIHSEAFEAAVFQNWRWFAKNSYQMEPSFHTARIAVVYGF